MIFGELEHLLDIPFNVAALAPAGKAGKGAEKQVIDDGERREDATAFRRMGDALATSTTDQSKPNQLSTGQTVHHIGGLLRLTRCTLRLAIEASLVPAPASKYVRCRNRVDSIDVEDHLVVMCLGDVVPEMAGHNQMRTDRRPAPREPHSTDTRVRQETDVGLQT